jgi:hypothetical protein
MEDGPDASKDLREYANMRRIRPLTLRQRRISEEILSPHIGDLMDILEIGRMNIDKEVEEAYAEDPTPRIFHVVSPSIYPVGHCEIIRDRMMEQIIAMARNPIDRKLPVMQAIGKIAHAGIPIGKVHGVIDYGHGIAFQNAIQMGHLILDGAMNTVSGQRQRVAVYDTDSGILRNIDSYQQYAGIVRDYWGMAVSSTARYFPNMAALFPLMLTNRANGKVEFAKYNSLFFGNIADDFRPSEEIARKADDFDELPAKARDYLWARCRKEKGWLEWRENKTQLTDVFQNHRRKFHPLLNGSAEEEKRKILEDLIRVYEGLGTLN